MPLVSLHSNSFLTSILSQYFSLKLFGNKKKSSTYTTAIVFCVSVRLKIHTRIMIRFLDTNKCILSSRTFQGYDACFRSYGCLQKANLFSLRVLYEAVWLLFLLRFIIEKNSRYINQHGPRSKSNLAARDIKTLKF